MIVTGLVALVVGAVLLITSDRGDLTVAGAVVMGAGALLLIAGILRLRRAARRPAASADEPYRTSKGKIIAMVAAVLYIVSPLDIIPDVLLPAGIVDDATALTWLVVAAGQELVRRRASRARQDGPPLSHG
jgi:uncharacterized membrane protein YkvA (DUF1232 family)